MLPHWYEVNEDSDPHEGKQTNLAEGERDVVDQSIQAHEQKGDLKPSGGVETSGTRDQNQNRKGA